METSDWIALGALGLAVASFIVSWRERSGRHEAVKQERDDRRDELRLLRQQVEAELLDRQAQKRAELTATTAGIEGGMNGGRVDRHHFQVMNLGPAVARELRFAAIGDAGTVASATVNVLLAERGEDVGLDIPMDPSRAGGLRLHAWWRDDSGEREADLVEVKRHG
jgi:hypothetical protein